MQGGTPENEMISQVKAAALDAFVSQLGLKSSTGFFPVAGMNEINPQWSTGGVGSGLVNASTYAQVNQRLFLYAGSPDYYQVNVNGATYDRSVYEPLLAGISYQLTQADLDQINNDSKAVLGLQTTMVTSWINNFGAIPPEKSATVAQQVNWITTTGIAQQGLLGTNPATNASYTIADLMQPGGAQRCILQTGNAWTKDYITYRAQYDGQRGSVISNQQTQANAGIQCITGPNGILRNPSASNGSMQVSDATRSWVPKWNFEPTVATIEANLQRGATYSTSVKIVNTSDSHTTVTVDGKAAGGFSFLGLFKFGASAGASYFKDVVAKEASTITINIEYTGAASMKVTPEAYTPAGSQAVAGTGWWNAPAVQGAQANVADTGNPPATTGYHYVTPPPPAGWVLEQVVMCQKVKLSVTFEFHKMNAFKEIMKTAASAGVTVLGFIHIASGRGATSKETEGTSSTDEKLQWTFETPVDATVGAETTAILLGASGTVVTGAA